MVTALEVTQDSEDLDEGDNKRLSILGKRARNSLSKLTRHVAKLVGEWYDKQVSKLHSHHVEQAKRLSKLLDNAWYVMDLFY